jgi:hypothetical protein
MQGIPSKIIGICLTSLIATTVFANNNDQDNDKIYNAKLGCMACHQGEAIDTQDDAQDKYVTSDQEQKKNAE